MQNKNKNGEAQRYSWECRIRIRMVKPRDIAGKAEEEEFLCRLKSQLNAQCIPGSDLLTPTYALQH